MKFFTIYFIVLCAFFKTTAQSVDEDLLLIRERMMLIQDATAEATLNLDVDFINMPEKYARLHYQKGKPLRYSSDQFIVIPKRGLDFTWSELFNHEFMTVDRGEDTLEGRLLKVLNVIPLDKKADFAIMTLKIDVETKQILYSEITTKNEGTFNLQFGYHKAGAFPSNVTVEFELERIRIPLNFMGKDLEIDKDEIKSSGPKKGKIFLALNWTYIE